MATNSNPVMWVGLEWIEAHCVIPDGFHKGQPYKLYDHQLSFLANFYRVKRSAKWNPDNPVTSQAFQYARGLLVEPQKKGKGPMSAAHICLEGMGPSLFAGWAEEGDFYDCKANGGCPCGWRYYYEPGEPKGMLRPTPQIQIVATSAEQGGNIYDALRPMITEGPLNEVALAVGMEFTRLPDEGRIEVVTAAASSKLGQRVTFVAQDEVGTWLPANKMLKLASTQLRGLAAMGARAVLTTNAWDPAENSHAQQEYEMYAKDVLVQFRQASAHLKWLNKADRRKILQFAYGEVATTKGGHVDLDSIEAEILKMIAKGLAAEAERFFGNRLVAGTGVWITKEEWELGAPNGEHWIPGPPAGTEVAGGFDGSLNDDFTVIKLETIDGRVFTPRYGPDNRPTIWNPKDWGGEIPRDQVTVAWEEIFRKYQVRRVYCDPGFRDETSWESEIEQWERQFGNNNAKDKEAIFIPWQMTGTSSYTKVYAALRRFESDLSTSKLTHDNCPITNLHVTNAQKIARTADRYGLTKPEQHQKIDAAVGAVLAHEAAADTHAQKGGWPKPKRRTRIVTGSSTRRRKP